MHFNTPNFFLQIIASVQVDSIETNGTISNKLQSYILGNATIEGGTSIAKGTPRLDRTSYVGTIVKYLS